MDKDEFKAKLQLTVESKILRLIRQKKEKQYLSYQDSVEITHMVKNIFVSTLGFVPPEIEAAYILSNTILAPNTVEKLKLLKQVKILALGSVGVMSVVGSIASLLGWGAGAKATFMAWCAGSSVLGPVSIGVLGAAAIVIAGYFVCSGDEEKRTEKYRNMLSVSLNNAVDSIWNQYKEKLSQVKVVEYGSDC